MIVSLENYVTNFASLNRILLCRCATASATVYLGSLPQVPQAPITICFVLFQSCTFGGWNSWKSPVENSEFFFSSSRKSQSPTTTNQKPMVLEKFGIAVGGRFASTKILSFNRQKDPGTRDLPAKHRSGSPPTTYKSRVQEQEQPARESGLQRVNQWSDSSVWTLIPFIYLPYLLDNNFTNHRRNPHLEVRLGQFAMVIGYTGELKGHINYLARQKSNH